PDGKYLYFLSGRDFNEVLGVYDFEFANPKAIRVYAVTLRADATSPFAPQSDEVEIKKANPDEKEEAKPSTGEEKTKKPEKAESKKAGQKPEEKKEAFRIDLDGIQNRVFSLPTPAESMAGLNASKGYVFYLTTPIFGLSGPLADEGFALHIFDLKERKDAVLVAG